MTICEVCRKREGHAISFKINIPLEVGDKKWGWSSLETLFLCEKCAEGGDVLRKHLELVCQRIRVQHGIKEKISVTTVKEKHVRGKL